MQYETQNESLLADLREAELKKEELQTTLVSFNEQLVTLKTREQGLLETEMDRCGGRGRERGREGEREREREGKGERVNLVLSPSFLHRHQPCREQEQSGVIHSANEMKRALEERLQQTLDGHQREVDQLKSEIAAKEAHISQVSTRYQDQLVMVNTLKEELEQTRHSYDAEKQNYAKIRTQMRIKERARRDLGGLSDTVVSW